MTVYLPPEVLETDNATHSGGSPAAQHVLDSLPYVFLPRDADLEQCAICFENICTQDDEAVQVCLATTYFTKMHNVVA